VFLILRREASEFDAHAVTKDRRGDDLLGIDPKNDGLEALFGPVWISIKLAAGKLLYEIARRSLT